MLPQKYLQDIQIVELMNPFSYLSLSLKFNISPRIFICWTLDQVEHCTIGKYTSGGRPWKKMSISATILLFWKPLFCQCLPQKTIILKYTKSAMIYINLPQLINLYLSFIFQIGRGLCWLPKFPLSNAQWEFALQNLDIRCIFTEYQSIEIWLRY